jgi:hypothetical protein
MRLVLSAVLTCSLAVTLLAQRGGHGGGGFGRGGVGMGRGGGFSHPGFGGGGVRGGFVSQTRPFRGGLGFRGGFRDFRFRGPRFFGYYGWPFLYDGFGYGGYGYSDSFYAPTYSYGYGYQPQAAPPVVVIEQSPPSVILEQPPPPPPAAATTQWNRSDEPALYLIAFNDHNIKLAVAYWTEKNTLRYVTMEHKIKTAPLSSVDRDLSKRLNNERRMPFSLPNG